MFITNQLVSCIVIGLISVSSVSAQLEKGDSCRTDRNQPGQCISITDCPSALKDIQQGIFPEPCGYEGTVPIVCCPKATPTTSERISVRKCQEYSSHVYELVEVPTLLITPQKVNQSVCGFVATPLVIGGVKADAKEFPHMALLGYRDRPNIVWRCGGTLVSEQWVMTAAHCLFARELGILKWVRLGDLNIGNSEDEADPVEFSVVERKRHPGHKPPSRYNDIALVKLDRPAVFNRYIRPACLVTGPVLDVKFLATGWGLVERDGQKLSDDLMKVTVQIFSNTECNSSYEDVISERTLAVGILPDSQMCAGGRNEEKDTCQGDSGGPLQIYHPKEYCMYSVVGVTSFGKSCGIKNVPGVYTRVAHYIDWLETNIWP